ncbi:MAG: hypothetical protein EZS28_028608, partial [Streblomastix strix]
RHKKSDMKLQVVDDENRPIEQFKVDMFKELGELMERIYEDTRNLIVGIFNVMFAIYKLLDTGAKNAVS